MIYRAYMWSLIYVLVCVKHDLVRRELSDLASSNLEGYVLARLSPFGTVPVYDLIASFFQHKNLH